MEAARQVTDPPQPLRVFNSPTLAVHPDEPLTAVVAVGDTRGGSAPAPERVPAGGRG